MQGLFNGLGQALLVPCNNNTFLQPSCNKLMQAQADLGLQNRQLLKAIWQHQEQQQQPQAVSAHAAQNMTFALKPGHHQLTIELSDLHGVQALESKNQCTPSFL